MTVNIYFVRFYFLGGRRNDRARPRRAREYRRVASERSVPRHRWKTRVLKIPNHCREHRAPSWLFKEHLPPAAQRSLGSVYMCIHIALQHYITRSCIREFHAMEYIGADVTLHSKLEKQQRRCVTDYSSDTSKPKGEQNELFFFLVFADFKGMWLQLELNSRFLFTTLIDSTVKQIVTK